MLLGSRCRWIACCVHRCPADQAFLAVELPAHMFWKRVSSALALALVSLTFPTPGLAAPSMDCAASAEQEIQTSSIASAGGRSRVWSAFRRVVGEFPPEASSNPFASWHTSDAVFGRSAVEAPGMLTPHQSISADGTPQSGDAPLITFNYYNQKAYEHIRNNMLHLRRTMEQLLRLGQVDPLIEGGRAIPPFPEGASVVLTAWWPVSATKATPVPVWDPENNPPRRMGNGYVTWNRTVLIDPVGRDGSEPVAVRFAGREFPNSRRVPLASFQHMRVDERLAAQIGAAFRLRKASVIALGRAIEAGDYLALVALHVATKEPCHEGWTWMTFWWHDEPRKGPFALHRPEDIDEPWQHYLLDFVADGGPLPEAGSQPAATFNPWLEARFPDGGQGGGMVSDCVSCHRRASYPPIDFLPIRPGRPDPMNDPAFAPGRLRTDFLWSVARSPSSTDRSSREGRSH